MPCLAVALAPPDTEAALAALQRASQVADLAELRLDLMAEFDLPRLLADRPLPLIVTCRPRREGGNWQGTETERLAVLRQAAALGADYVDLEGDSLAALASLDRTRTRLILSRHDFSAMPADLTQQAARLWAAGADVVKLVGLARSLADCAPILRLLANATRSTIAIAMGDSGLSTRLLAFRYPHAFLSFGALAEQGAGSKVQGAGDTSEWGRGTAPGQVGLRTMRDLFRVKAMTAETAIVGLLGPQANRSPLLAEGNAWLAAQGLGAVLVPLQPAPGEDPEEALASLQSVAPLAGYLPDVPFPQAGTDSIAARLQQLFVSREESEP